MGLSISLSPAIFIDSPQSFPLIKAISFSLGLLLNVIPHSQGIKASNIYSLAAFRPKIDGKQIHRGLLDLEFLNKAPH